MKLRREGFVLFRLLRRWGDCLPLARHQRVGDHDRLDVVLIEFAQEQAVVDLRPPLRAAAEEAHQQGNADEHHQQRERVREARLAFRTLLILGAAAGRTRFGGTLRFRSIRRHHASLRQKKPAAAHDRCRILGYSGHRGDRNSSTGNEAGDYRTLAPGAIGTEADRDSPCGETCCSSLARTATGQCHCARAIRSCGSLFSSGLPTRPAPYSRQASCSRISRARKKSPVACGKRPGFWVVTQLGTRALVPHASLRPGSGLTAGPGCSVAGAALGAAFGVGCASVAGTGRFTSYG